MTHGAMYFAGFLTSISLGLVAMGSLQGGFALAAVAGVLIIAAFAAR